MSKDPLGDRIKFYENKETGRLLMPQLPVIARLDGRSFSKFTKGLERPFDVRLHNLMIEVTTALVKEANATIGYTQSDEITIGWYIEDPKSQDYFGGRIFKITSQLASIATGLFNKLLPDYLPEKTHLLPTFDCRVFNVPTFELFYESFLWRELDASKNSVSMAARHYFSHSALQKRTSSEMQDLLMTKGVNWNDYPAAFKRGTYIQKYKSITNFSKAELEKLPAKHAAHTNPNLKIERQLFRTLNPQLSKVTNQKGFLLNGEEPNIVQRI